MCSTIPYIHTSPEGGHYRAPLTTCLHVRQIIGGSLATRVGGRSVLLFAVLLWSLSTVITPLVAHSIVGLILCRILLGLGEGLGNSEPAGWWRPGSFGTWLLVNACMA